MSDTALSAVSSEKADLSGRKTRKTKKQGSAGTKKPAAPPAPQWMQQKSVTVSRPGEPFCELPAEFEGKLDLSRVTEKDASAVLGIDINRIRSVLQPRSDGEGAAKEELYDIRLIRSALNNQRRHDADITAVAISDLQARLLRGEAKVLPSEAADLHCELTTNVFRAPRHIEPVFRSKQAARKVLAALVQERIARISEPMTKKDFRDSLFVCFRESSTGRRKQNAPKQKSSLESCTEKCLRLDIHIGHNAAGRAWQEVLKEIQSALTNDSKGVSGICDIRTDRIYTDAVLSNPIPPTGFDARLFREYEADPDIGEWFDPERLGRRRHTGRYWDLLREDAVKIWPMAEFLSSESIQALITLFGDPVGFLAQYGGLQKPADPHGRLPAVYAVSQDVWTKWTESKAEIVLRNGTWERVASAQVVISLFNYRVGIFRRGDRAEIYAKDLRNEWLSGRPLERLRANLCAAGFDLRTGFLRSGGKLMPPALLFDGIAKGVLTELPPAVAEYRDKRAAVLENQRNHNRRHSARRKERRTPDQAEIMAAEHARKLARELIASSEANNKPEKRKISSG